MVTTNQLALRPNDPNEAPFYNGEYRNSLSLANRLGRALWGVVQATLFRMSPIPCFGWRRFLLRLFGATIAPSARAYPSAKIWAPWNLVMHDLSCLGPEAYCYNVGRVVLGTDATVSFRSFLCSASHDIRHPARPLVTGDIEIKRGAYIFADAFIGMNVTVGEGAVVAARAVVVKDVAPYDIVGGNPARVIGRRDMAELAE